MERLSFATLASPGTPAARARLLASSIRRFGGRLAASPIRVMLGDDPAEQPGWPEARGALLSLGVTITPSVPAGAETEFPFFGKVAAAAAAEGQARGEDDLLVWLDADTIVLREPSQFLLPSTTSLGCRPVHHRLIGPGWEDPLDRFWQLIYSFFGVPEDRLFPMTTHAGERITPYLNAGLLVVRPGRGLLARWWDNCRAALGHRGLMECCRDGELHALFLHQAVLTATVLAALPAHEMHQFGPEVNYPLHLHHEMPPERRVSLVDELTTVRYEEVLARPGWQERFPMSPSLRHWLEANLGGRPG